MVTEVKYNFLAKMSVIRYLMNDEQTRFIEWEDGELCDAYSFLNKFNGNAWINNWKIHL